MVSSEPKISKMVKILAKYWLVVVLSGNIFLYWKQWGLRRRIRNSVTPSILLWPLLGRIQKEYWRGPGNFAVVTPTKRTRLTLLALSQSHDGNAVLAFVRLQQTPSCYLWWTRETIQVTVGDTVRLLNLFNPTCAYVVSRSNSQSHYIHQINQMKMEWVWGFCLM